LTLSTNPALAPLSQIAGDVLATQTRVIANFGATETAALPRLAPSVADWQYYYWHPSHSGIELREYMDGLFELFLVKDSTIDLYQGIFSTFPELQEYSMNDLYARHPDPSKPFLYKWTGRADDVIVLSNGEKLAPPLMESSLRSSPLVKGAMVVGRGKFQPAALIDLGAAPPTDPSERYALVRELAPAIAEANKHAPAHGKLDEYHILFVDPARPIFYLGQGKIQRHKTLQLYEKDIEEVYVAAENFDEQLLLGEIADLARIDFSDRPSIKKWLKERIAEIAELQHLKGDDPFFEIGMDSLHVIKLVRELKFQAKLGGGEKLTPESLSPGVVYANPSLNELADFLLNEADLVQDVDSAYQSGDSDDNAKPKVKDEKKKLEKGIQAMETLLDGFVKSLPVASKVKPAPVTEGLTVLLTGSTGSLGSYILNELYNDPNVAHIIALDRSANAAEKHKQSGPKRGLSSIDPERVEFLESDLSDSHLGLGKEVYRRVMNTVTHIIHCQWPVNFNWNLNSFKPYIAGVRNLAVLAAHSSNNAFVLFVSSIAAVGGYKGPGQVPESIIHDMTAAAPMGYGQSKLIAECLLDMAAEISGVRTAVARVGIVAGPVEQQLGKWNVHEYIPSVSTPDACNLNPF